MLHQHPPNPNRPRLGHLIEAGFARFYTMLGGRGRRSSLTRKNGEAPRRTRQPLLIHYHIFKNAGTSFEWALQQVLGDRYRPLDSATPRGFVSKQDLSAFSYRHPEVCAISSHQAAPPPPSIRGRDVLTSILIRDPIARIRSIYAFERSQQASTPGALKAKQLTFSEYVEWRLENSPAMLCNYQVHFCTRTGQHEAGVPTHEELVAAIRNLDQISIVGTVARYNEWIALAQKILSGAFPNFTLAPARRNATTGPDLSAAGVLEQLVQDLGERLTDHLLKNNELDFCLHQIADALLTRKLAEYDVRVTLAEAYANAYPHLHLPAESTSKVDP
ncbi:hypothetical protein BH20VER3_BH20VER3_15920 [soil metagenome]